MLTSSSLTRWFGDGTDAIRALHGVSVIIRPGEFIALEGPSGCGKSTLLHLLAGLDVATEGSVTLDTPTGSVALGDLSESDRAIVRLRHIGIVLPVVDLIGSLSSWENVAMPLLLVGKRISSGRKRAESLLVQVGLGHRMNVAAGRLSTGEAQRVSLARALFHEPAVLLADEPTSFLDSVRSDEILRFLRSLADGGQTIIMATHDARSVAYADRSIRLLDGEVVETD